MNIINMLTLGMFEVTYTEKWSRKVKGTGSIRRGGRDFRKGVSKGLTDKPALGCILKVRRRSKPGLSGGRASIPDGDNSQGNEPVCQAQCMGCWAGVRSRAERWERGLGRRGVYPTERRAHWSDICIPVPASPLLINLSGCWFKKQLSGFFLMLFVC